MSHGKSRFISRVAIPSLTAGAAPAQAQNAAVLDGAEELTGERRGDL